MKNIKMMTTIGGLFLTAAVALAQVAPPAPPPLPAEPAAPAAAPAPPPRAVRAPRPVAAPAPMAVFDLPDMPAPPAAPAPRAMPAPPEPAAVWLNQDWQDGQKAMDKAAEAVEKAQEKMANIDWEVQQKAMEKVQEKLATIDWDAQQRAMAMIDSTGKVQVNWDDFAPKAKAMADVAANMKFNFNFDKAPLAAQTRIIGFGGKGNDESLYNSGLTDIDNHRYDQALADFNVVVTHAGARAEGGLYWKAYVLNKLGRAADAQAAIEQLRKTYPKSGWLDDAKVLELEVKQSKGPVSPESETDEDIKILALNGLMQSDPEHALPQVENLIKTSHSFKLKRQAVNVIGMNGSPRAKQDLEGIARGANPDLQLVALRYLGSNNRRNDNTSSAALFAEVYAASSDKAVKQYILSSFRNSKDKDHLVQILKSEKDPDLRNDVIRALGEFDGQPELWQLYPSETTVEGKTALLEAMHQNGNIDKIGEVARTDKDPKVRQTAIRILADQRPGGSGNPGAAIAAAYASEQDENVKTTIINNLANMRNAKALIDIARVEKDTRMKLRIVQHLSNMTKFSKEASDYLQELLSK